MPAEGSRTNHKEETQRGKGKLPWGQVMGPHHRKALTNPPLGYFCRGGLQMSSAEPPGPTGHARGPIWRKDTYKELQDAAAFNMAKCCVA